MRGPWTIGIEDAARENGVVVRVEHLEGGVATREDARRYCYIGGVRLGHLLDPRTGWPVTGAPRSATVAKCTAGTRKPSWTPKA
jgi:thiamine biosynthesis lipoprotein